MQRRIRILVCILIVILCGCTSKEKNQVRFLLDWWPNPIHVPLYVGISQGYFLDEGIDLEIIKCPDAPETVPYLLSQRADVALYYMPNTIKAGQRTDELEVIGVLIDRPLRAFVFREDSGIRTPKDLQGKIIGANPEGFFGAYVKAAMNKWGIEFKEIRKVQFDPTAALMTRSVDVISGVFWNVEPELMRLHGVPTHYFTMEDFQIPSFDELIFISRKSFLKENAQFSTRFRKAIQKSIDFCKTHPDEAFSLYWAFHPDKSDMTKKWEKNCWDLTYPLYASKQELSEEKWRLFYAWLQENHLLKVEYDVGALWKGEGEQVAVR